MHVPVPFRAYAYQNVYRNARLCDSTSDEEELQLGTSEVTLTWHQVAKS